MERQVVAMKRRNKMGARKVTQYIGTQECHFDSLAERNYALWLEQERLAGRVDQWVHHPGRVRLFGLQGRLVASMEPDFSVWRADDAHEYHEVKGMATSGWRVKRALFEQQCPEIPYVVIDASHVNPPLLFDDRRKRKAARKKARKEKRK